MSVFGKKTDLSTTVGSVKLPNPVMTASGTAGYGDELGAYLDYDKLGAFVIKSLRCEPWEGNPGPRVWGLQAGMLNSIGLPGPGVEAWLEDELPALLKHTDRVVAAIWGFTPEEYVKAAEMMSHAPKEVIAVEINVSCPNTDADGKVFASSASMTAELVEACQVVKRPTWAKLTPAVPNIVEIADAAYNAGAEAVVLSNTLPAMAIDIEKREYLLGAGPRGGGFSGAGLHPVAIRLVHDVRAAFPDRPIIGVGGIATAEDAIEFFMAGANAVQVGAATFLDPRAPVRIARDIERWCAKHNITNLSELIGSIHDRNRN